MSLPVPPAARPVPSSVALFATALGLLLLAGWLSARNDASVGAPMSLAPTAESAGFQADGFPPDLSGRDELPAWGTQGARDGATTGTWVSAPLTSTAALLQFRVSGRLHPPDTTLVLRTADGRELAPLENDFSSPDRWKRINFSTPAGSFQIVARDNSTDDWLAFTAPVEVSRWSWLLGKLARPEIIATFAVLAAGLALAAVWRTREALAASAASPGWRWVPWCALVAYAVFFSRHIDPVAGPNDSGGYLNSAKALASGHLGPELRPVWGAAAGETDLTPYVAITFHSPAGGRMAPEYPVGLPLVFAAAGRLFTMERGVPLVILLQLVLGVFFTRQLARAVGLPPGWDWLAAGIIGLSPVYLFQGLQPQSDGPALVWCTAAVYWAWTSRKHPLGAVFAGLATGLAVLIRPSNALIIFPIAIALFGAWRQVALWILAGLPAAAWLGWYNHTLYGSAFLTGYGDRSSDFALHFIPLTLRSCVQWLPLLFTPLIVLAPAGLFLRELPPRLRLLLGGWAGVFAAFYACYWCTWDNWYNMRFLLPAAPALVVLALFVTRALAARAGLGLFRPGPFGRNFAPTCLLVAAVALQLNADFRSRRVLYWLHNNSLNTAGPEWLQEHAPANAVIFAKHATNSLLYNTGFTFVRTDHPSAQSADFLARLARTGRPVYALNYWWEGHGQEGGPGRGQGRPTVPGTWTRLATLRGDEIHLWQWTPPAPAR